MILAMRTYGDAFAVGEFRALLGGQLAAAAGQTIQALSLSVLVFGRTHSTLLAAIAFLGGSIPQAVGAVALSGLFDRRPPRRVLVASDCARALAALLLASGIVPVGGMLAVVILAGVASGALGGVRYALVARVLPLESYALGRSMLNMASSTMQIVGYGAGGALLVTLGSARSLWVATTLAFLAAVSDRFGVRARPPGRTGSSSVAEVTRASLTLLTDRYIGRLLLAQWLPNGLIVGAEALYVPYAGRHAPVLYATGAAGMLLGDVTTGRFIPPGRRARAALPLYLLLALPYLAFVARPGLWPATVVVGLASVGFGGSLCTQQQIVERVPQRTLGQVLALASAGMLSAQGLAAALAGALASAITPAPAMAVMAAISLLASFMLLTPRREVDPPLDEEPGKRCRPGARRPFANRVSTPRVVNERR
jgi:MFS family permease